MKRRTTHVTLLAAGTLIGINMLTLPVFAAQGDPAIPGSTRTGISDTNKTFGHIERANKLIGKTVMSSDNQKLGKIDNLVVDLMSGHVLYAIVGSGGVLGAGEHRFAVPPEIFTDTEGNNVRINVDKQKLNGAPQFTSDMDKDTELGKADFVSKVYQYFGQSAWWQGSTPANQGSFNNVHKINDLIGMKVNDVGNQQLAKVDNLAIDLPAGRVVYVILSPDSSLNLGNDYYPFPPDALTLGSDGKSLTTGVTKEKLASAPHFAKNNWEQLSNQSWAAQVYQYYGKQAYFQPGGGLPPTGR